MASLASKRSILKLPGVLVEDAGPVHDIDEFQFVAPAHGKVVGIMRRGDLDRPGPKVGIDKFIGDHPDLAVNERVMSTSCRSDFLYRLSFGFTATAVSPSMVSGRVVATTIH